MAEHTPAGSGSPTVLYLGGLGRSGTTLLERCLGTSEDVFPLGEVWHLWRRSLLDDEMCGCGQNFSRCPFWQQVGDVAFGGWTSVDAARIIELRGRVDRSKRLPSVVSGISSAAFKDELSEYASYFARLYAAAAQVSGASVLVDSSKQASLPYVLQTSDQVDLRVLHCVRDSRAVAYSWGKQVERPEAQSGAAQSMARYSPAKSAFYWMLHNEEVDLLQRRKLAYMRLRYEDWLADVRGSLRRVRQFAGLSPQTSGNRVGADWVDLVPNHTCSGNPMRFRQGELKIRLDDTWRHAMPQRDRQVVQAMTWPLLRRYGYLHEQTA